MPLLNRAFVRGHSKSVLAALKIAVLSSSSLRRRQNFMLHAPVTVEGRLGKRLDGGQCPPPSPPSLEIAGQQCDTCDHN
jgi:hypothetical protein